MSIHLASLLLVAAVLLIASTSLAGTFAKIEAAFELPQVTGNPFDFTANDVRVTLTSPDGKAITLPAFFDGGTTWRVRHAPTTAGKWSVGGITLNGTDTEARSIEPREFNVTGDDQPTYVRVNPKDAVRFALDDGAPYYPVGYNLAWHRVSDPAMPPLVESLARMKAAGVNWTRIWMNHWDGKNLDWAEPVIYSPKPGTLSLDVARNWDAIIDAAEASDVRLQMVLQHHGQYSTGADANWQINPWNLTNGGWLTSPTQFFSDEKARALTRAKYRYIIARWGYSPAVMAWELFNEVEYTDAFANNLVDVANWHAEMAKFLREQDAYRHLITTSSRIDEPTLWLAMDYYQSHVYKTDLVTAVRSLDTRPLDKPYFFGEIGSSAHGTQSDPDDTIHRSLWASMMTGASGAAQYWYWYEAEPRGLLFHYTAAQKFIRDSGLLERRSALKPIDVAVTTGTGGTGGDWLRIRKIALTPYAPEIAVVAKGTSDYAVLWAYRRDAGDPSTAVVGTLSVPGLDAGPYRVRWTDPRSGAVLQERRVIVEGTLPLTLSTGPIATDVAISIRR